MPFPRSLLDMPDVVMDKIMEDVDFKTICSLRKVCQNIRNYMNDQKFKVNSDRINVHVQVDQIVINYCYEVQVEYQNYQNGCLVKYGENQKLLENSDFLDIVMIDLEWIITHQNGELQSFGILWDLDSKFEKFMELTKNILGSRQQFLKVTTLSMSVMEQQNLMSILPFLDPKLLSLVVLKHPNDSPNGMEITTIQINKIVKLDQWKQIKQLKVYGLAVSTPIQNLIHFENVQMILPTFSWSDLIAVKEIFLDSSTTHYHFKFHISNFKDHKTIFELLGPANNGRIDEDCIEKKWFFRNPNKNDEVLIIGYCSYDGRTSFDFSCDEIYLIPKGSVIQD